MPTPSDQPSDLFKTCEALGQIENQFPLPSQQSEALHEAAMALAWIAAQSDLKAAYQRFREAELDDEETSPEFRKYLTPEFTAQLDAHFRAPTQKAAGL